MANNSTKNPRIPPQSVESEKALLGAIMLKPESMADVLDYVAPDSFYIEKHKTIFRAMLDLSTKNDPIDMLSVSTRLRERKLFDSIGGSAYLTELTESAPAASNASHYAKVVQKKAVMRTLINTASHISELGFKEDSEMEEVLDEAEQKIFSVTNLPIGKKILSVKETLKGAWERIESLQGKDGGLRGVPTGFRSLDNFLSGFQKSDLVILAARPSMGKTSLALDIARGAARQGVPVGVFSLEMSSDQLTDRLIAAESHVDAWKLRTGKLNSDEEFSRLRDALDTLSKSPIFIDDNPSNTVMGMRSSARRLKSEHDLGLVIIDYLQLITPMRQYDSMVQQVTEISRSLKALARELDIPVLALSQLSRAIEQRQGRPRLSDLRDSGSIEQDADAVLFIHNESKYKEESDEGQPHIAEILIEKHRNGPTGKIELHFDDKKASFLDIERNEYAGAENLEEF